ncbi:MAG: ubiquinol oxidase subunit II [Candidatus Saccharimonadales bacterium]
MARESKRAPVLLAAAVVVSLAVIVLAVWLLAGKNIAVLNSAGTIAEQERNLILLASLLSLIIVVPVFGLTFYIAWKYRASNKKAKYEPNWDRDKRIEALWWGVPLALIAVLSVITWVTSHRLDPFKPLASSEQPLQVQVVALEWKWLFIYPEQNIATVNFVQFPEDRPVTFIITSDAPMNSFWIPQLGGQIYAMSGMSTRLHLQADQPGEYHGSSANISGRGFAGMTFTAKSSTQNDFDAWVRSVQNSDGQLDKVVYGQLAAPSENNPVAYYAPVQTGLYDEVVDKFMSHSGPRGTQMPNTYRQEHH